MVKNCVPLETNAKSMPRAAIDVAVRTKAASADNEFDTLIVALPPPGSVIAPPTFSFPPSLIVRDMLPDAFERLTDVAVATTPFGMNIVALGVAKETGVEAVGTAPVDQNVVTFHVAGDPELHVACAWADDDHAALKANAIANAPNFFMANPTPCPWTTPRLAIPKNSRAQTSHCRPERMGMSAHSQAGSLENGLQITCAACVAYAAPGKKIHERRK